MRILRGLASRLLSCGCLIGIYELYDGRTVGVVDHRGSECQLEQHRVGARLERLPGQGNPRQPSGLDGPDHARGR